MHSPTDGHFFVYVLDIVSNAAMNMSVQVSSQISVFIVVGCIPRNGFAGLCGSSIFYFLRRLLSVFHGSCTNLHSHNRAQGFPFLHILASICYSCIFDNSHSDRCEVLTCCGFDLHFPDDWWCRAYFHVPVCWKTYRKHPYIFFFFFSALNFIYSHHHLSSTPMYVTISETWFFPPPFFFFHISSLENIYLDSLPRLYIKLSFVLLLSCYWNSSYILDIKLSLDIWLSDIFSNSVCCLFILLMVSFVVKIFSVNIVSFVCFCLHCLCFWHQIQKTIAKTQVKEFTTYILF